MARLKQDNESPLPFSLCRTAQERGENRKMKPRTHCSPGAKPRRGPTRTLHLARAGLGWGWGWGWAWGWGGLGWVV